MKQLALLFSILLIPTAFFYFGQHCGPSSLDSDDALIRPTIDRRLQELSNAANLLHLLDTDTSDTNKLRARLQSQMFLALLDVDSLSGASDANQRDLAHCLTKQIAKYRAEGCPSFIGHLANWSDDSVAQFEALLKRATAEPAK
jgi:hypothetical protein